EDDAAAGARTVDVREQVALALDPAKRLGRAGSVPREARPAEQRDEDHREDDEESQPAARSVCHGKSILPCLGLRGEVPMLDLAELERTLDLWASMWLAEERVQFERALERVVDGDVPMPLKAAAVAACRIIATPRLLGAADRAGWLLEDETVAHIDAVA